jgi:hypothetical protein
MCEGEVAATEPCPVLVFDNSGVKTLRSTAARKLVN